MTDQARPLAESGSWALDSVVPDSPNGPSTAWFLDGVVGAQDVGGPPKALPLAESGSWAIDSVVPDSPTSSALPRVGAQEDHSAALNLPTISPATSACPSLIIQTAEGDEALSAVPVRLREDSGCETVVQTLPSLTAKPSRDREAVAELEAPSLLSSVPLCMRADPEPASVIQTPLAAADDHDIADFLCAVPARMRDPSVDEVVQTPTVFAPDATASREADSEFLSLAAVPGRLRGDPNVDEVLQTPYTLFTDRDADSEVLSLSATPARLRGSEANADEVIQTPCTLETANALFADPTGHTDSEDFGCFSVPARNRASPACDEVVQSIPLILGDTTYDRKCDAEFLSLSAVPLHLRPDPNEDVVMQTPETFFSAAPCEDLSLSAVPLCLRADPNPDTVVQTPDILVSAGCSSLAGGDILSLSAVPARLRGEDNGDEVVQTPLIFAALEEDSGALCLSDLPARLRGVDCVAQEQDGAAPAKEAATPSRLRPDEKGDDGRSSLLVEVPISERPVDDFVSFTSGQQMPPDGQVPPDPYHSFTPGQHDVQVPLALPTSEDDDGFLKLSDLPDGRLRPCSKSSTGGKAAPVVPVHGAAQQKASDSSSQAQEGWMSLVPAASTPKALATPSSVSSWGGSCQALDMTLESCKTCEDSGADVQGAAVSLPAALLSESPAEPAAEFQLLTPAQAQARPMAAGAFADEAGWSGLLTPAQAQAKPMTASAFADEATSPNDDHALTDCGTDDATSLEGQEEFDGVPLADAVGLSDLSFCMPESIYGTAMLSGVLVPCETWPEWFEQCGPCYLRLLVNYLVQVLLLVAVAEQGLQQERSIHHDDGCDRLHWVLYALCGWVYFAMVLNDVEETCHMANLMLFEIPTTVATTYFRYARGVDDELVLREAGFSVCRKVFLFFAVITPKASLAAGMVSIGGYFVASSKSNEDLLLNCLAVIFIVEVDKLVYATLVPTHTKCTIQALPPFEASEMSPAGRTVMRFGPVLKFIASIALVFLLEHPHGCPSSRCDDSPELCFFSW